MALKFYKSVTRELKRNVGKIRGLILTFVEVTWEKLVGGPFPPPPILNSIKVKQAQEARDNQFLFQNVQKMRFLRSSKCSKTIAELTFTTQKTNACFLLDWLSYSVVPFFGKFGSKTQIVILSWNLESFKYAEFHGDVYFFSFWLETPFFG